MPRIELEDKLNSWLSRNKNVLFIGRHGVGKTSIVEEVFKKAGLNWLYFSASTMDPWVDFIGVPKEMKDPEGGEPYLGLVRPKPFRDDQIQALFFDELNRSHKKVRNAIMELIQFKSINGRKFNNLRVVWAAINPADDKELSYDVEDLDPAQKDRFHVHVTIPYMPQRGYFADRYDPETADLAIEWWKGLSKSDQELISPRRLDYCLEEWEAGGDIRNFVIPESANVTKLLTMLESASYVRKISNILRENDNEKLTTFLKDENNFAGVSQYILRDNATIKRCFPYITEEKQVKLICEKKEVERYVLHNIPEYRELLEQITNYNSGISSVMKNKIRARLDATKKDVKTDQDLDNIKFKKFSSKTEKEDRQKLADLKKHNTYNMTGGTATPPIDANNVIFSAITELKKLFTKAGTKKQREAYLASLDRVATAKMSMSQARVVGLAVEAFCEKSTATTIDKNPDLTSLINKVFHTYFENNHTIEKLYDIFPNVFSKVIIASKENKLDNSKRKLIVQ